MADRDRVCRQGVLAFGDSITHGGGTVQRDVVQESWALWVARALGLPYSGFAVDGARLAEVVEEQLPAARAQCARPQWPFDLGLLYAGVNDVRRPDWDPEAFARLYERALAAIGERCDGLLVATLPLGLGRPRAPDAVGEANAVIERIASAYGALVADLRDFGGRSHVLADQIHPTAFGQIDIADRALRVLEASGHRVLARPRELIRPAEATPLRTLGSDTRYAARRVRVGTRAAAIRLLRRGNR